jgi:Ni,Fe-hydrogenase I large subunit
MKVFDWLKQITYNKKSWNSFSEDDKSSFNVYMMHRYLSMEPDYIDIVNYVQVIPHNEKEKIYKIYCNMIPKKNIFLKYIKSLSKKKTSDSVLQFISKEYTCSLGEAEEYSHLLGKNGIISILHKHGVDEKEQKKILKELSL